MHREQRAAHVHVKGLIEVFRGNIDQVHQFAHAGAGKQHVNLSLGLLDRLVQPVKIVQVRSIALNPGHIPANRFHRFIQLILAPAGDEDIRALFHEKLGRCQRHTRRCRSNDCYLSVQFSHSTLLSSWLGLSQAAAGQDVFTREPAGVVGGEKDRDRSNITRLP